MQLINSKYYSGYMVVYGEKIYVNTSTGSGFITIFEHMKVFIDKLALKYSNTLDGFEDAKQEIYLSILEGILKYNPNKEASLSTFLDIFVKNNMLDKIRKINLRKNKQLFTDDTNIDLERNIFNKLELEEKTYKLCDKWKFIMFRLFVFGENICDIANDFNMTPWTLTRALRKKLIEIRKK